MSDDDYFTDDIVFDEQTLAVLDLEEQKYLSQHPAKRQKIDVGWKPRPGSVVDDLDLPEISLGTDGFYGVRSTPMTPSEAVDSNASGLSHRRVSPVPPPRVHAPNVRRSSAALRTRPPPTRSTNDPHRNALPVHDVDLEQRLGELQRKLEQVSRENNEIQTALKEATTARMTKEGEVAVLRRGMEKTAKDHAAHLVRLKTEQDEAATKYARLQKEMKEEVERMKTELQFKSHEQESFRKTNLQSARAKKIFLELSAPQAMLTSTQNTPIAHRHRAEKSPVHPLVFEKPRNVVPTRSNMLPGFQNTFNDALPLHSSKAIPQQIQQPLTQSQRLTRAPSDAMMDVVSHEEFHAPQATDDIQMMAANENIHAGSQDAELVDTDGSDVEIPEEAEPIEPLNQIAELSRIVLSHSLPPSTTATIHAVLGAQLPDSVPPGLITAYSTSCTQILEVVANTSPFLNLDSLIDSIAKAFVTMIPVLRAADLFGILTPLLNLLTLLVYAFPRLASSMLSQPYDDQTADPLLLVTLGKILLDHREIAKHTPCEDLVAETIRLFEALCFKADEATIDLLTYIPRHRQIWISLIHNTQSNYILTLVVRFLVALASHRKICRALLSMPEASDTNTEKAPEPTKIPLIERLCMLLVDPSRRDAQSKQTKQSILSFFALLSTSQPDIHTYLLNSTVVLPSVILYLSQLTAVFWEDDEILPSLPAREIESATRTLNQTLFFLYYLVFTSTSFLNLRQRIYVPQHRIFNGLMHHFIVTFGRLSYSEAPEWMDDDQRVELLSLTEMARDILDLVVDGPEADRTWQTYQTEVEAASETDEEEMEKKFLGDAA